MSLGKNYENEQLDKIKKFEGISYSIISEIRSEMEVSFLPGFQNHTPEIIHLISQSTISEYDLEYLIFL